MQNLAKHISTFSETVGRLVSWLTLAMVLVTVVVVVLRKFFGIGWIWLQESVTWMHAAVFMLAAAYTLKADEHVRVDVFYTRFSPRRKALVDLLGTVLLLLPLCIFIIWASWDYVFESWNIREASWQSGGLPALYLLKGMIPLMAILVALQGISQSLVNYLSAKDKQEPS